MTTKGSSRAVVMLAATLLLAAAAGGRQAQPNPTAVEVEFYPVPGGGTIFGGLLVHSNGKVYVGVCYNIARLIEFDPATKPMTMSRRSLAMRVVARMTSQALEGGGPDLADPVLRGDLGPGAYPDSSWKFAQDKIHTQLHEGVDGRVYGGTHTKVENADATRSYPGGHWFAYDPKTEKVEDLGWARRNEGIIATCYDRERNVLYGLTWPTGYLVSCKPDEPDYAKRLHTLDLASSRLDCVPRYLDVVKDGRVYMADGATGDLRVYVPAEGRLLSVLGLSTPTQAQEKVPATLRDSSAWRNWWMGGTRSPDGMHIFTTGQRGGRLTEVDATQGKWGVVIDHGRTVPWGEAGWAGPYADGMVFGRDGLLYHTVGPQLLTYNVKDGQVLDWGRTVIKESPEVVLHLGGGALGPDGRLYFRARRDRQPGIAVLDPARLKGSRLLRVSQRVVLRPWAERRLTLP